MPCKLSSQTAKEIQAQSKENIAIIPRGKGKWAYGSWSDCFTTVIGQDPLFTTQLLTLPMMALQKYKQTTIKKKNSMFRLGQAVQPRDLNYCPNELKQRQLLQVQHRISTSISFYITTIRDLTTSTKKGKQHLGPLFKSSFLFNTRRGKRKIRCASENSFRPSLWIICSEQTGQENLI